MEKIQNISPIYFSGYKVRYTQKQVKEITEKDERYDIVSTEHMGAHRNAVENKLQIMRKPAKLANYQSMTADTRKMEKSNQLRYLLIPARSSL